MSNASEDKVVDKVFHFVIFSNDNGLNRRITWMGINSEEGKIVREN
jgi:hypothetical protein